MFKFNPGLYIDDSNDMYSLIRCETNIGGGALKPKKCFNNWGRSVFSYDLNKVNRDTLQGTYIDKIQFNMYDKISCGDQLQRNSLGEGEYILEDVKFTNNLGSRNRFICNVLTTHGMKTREFRVGIGTFDITKPVLRLDKILELPQHANEEPKIGTNTMMDCEKNWCPYTYNNEVYLIYRLFPVLVIYKLSLDDYSLKRVHISDTYDIVRGTHIADRQNPSYKWLFLTPCTAPVKIDNDNMLIFCKRSRSDRIYEYYKCYFNAKTFEILFTELNVPFTTGYKKYLNNVLVYNSEVYMGWGIKDTTSIIERYPVSEVLSDNFIISND